MNDDVSCRESTSSAGKKTFRSAFMARIKRVLMLGCIWCVVESKRSHVFVQCHHSCGFRLKAITQPFQREHFRINRAFISSRDDLTQIIHQIRLSSENQTTWRSLERLKPSAPLQRNTNACHWNVTKNDSGITCGCPAGTNGTTDRIHIAADLHLATPIKSSQGAEKGKTATTWWKSASWTCRAFQRHSSATARHLP